MVDMVLLSDRVMIPDGDRVIVTPAAIALSGRHIAAVARGATRQEALIALGLDERLPRDDLGGALLAPAFIDGHTHLALHALRGLTGRRQTETNVVEDLFYRFESGLSATEVRAFARMGAYEALIHGTGLVFDHYFHGLEIAGAAREVGLCAAVAPTIQDLGGPFAHASEAGLVDTEALLAAEWSDAGIAPMLGPHAMDTVSPDLWRRIADMASRHRLPVHVHVAQSLEEVDRVAGRTGRTPALALLDTGVLDAAPTTLAVHMIYASRADLRALPVDKVVLGHCPHSSLVFGHPARIDVWEESGHRWLVGSDTAASNDALDVRNELRLVLGQAALSATFSRDYSTFLDEGRTEDAREAWLVRAGTRGRLSRLFDPGTLLAAVTRIPGGVHPNLVAGEITPGALASFALWDVDHPTFWPATDPLRSLALADAAPALLQVMTRGLWRGERGRFASSIVDSPEYREHRAEASARLAERLERLGLRAPTPVEPRIPRT